MANADTTTNSDPFDMRVEERQRLMRRGVLDAARVYKMHGVKMIVGDKQGRPYEIDPDEVLKNADADDGRKAG